MKAIIYETINLYNKERGILPYKYIGSDQYNKSNYLGSNKKLMHDIKKLGYNCFIKNILFEYDSSISNVELRKLESDYQQKNKIAENPEYYNRTNSSHVGYIETKEEKSIRMNKTHIAFRVWWDNLSEEDKQQHILKSSIGANNGMKGKTYDEIYGKEKAKLIREKNSDINNGMSKAILHIPSDKIFNTMKSIAIFLKINPTSSGYYKIRKMCDAGIEIKYIN